MPLGYDLVQRLRSPSLSPSQRGADLREFARITGWRPSYELEYPETQYLVSGHLLVEHGLEPMAAISFLLESHPFSSLDWADQNRLLAISYNNLVDWHCFPDSNGLWIVYNRTRPVDARYHSLADDPNAWRAEEFDRLVGRKPSPNLPALDDALIRTVSEWRRILAGEFAPAEITENLSELFNAIFFVRALEDDRRKNSPNTERALLAALDLSDKATNKTVRSVLRAAMRSLGLAPAKLPKDLLHDEKLRAFDGLAPETTWSLFSNFYDNKFAPYRYDFSLMSKHALSRIYEHYISLLKQPVSEQPTLFPLPADEEPNRLIGGVYTPQYIARFFARFLEAAHTPPRFRQLRVADPACGSGIFLRTLLEMQCDPARANDPRKTAQAAFANVLGIDVEPSASQAARLSLSLLYLVLTGEFPKNLQIKNAEAVAYLAQHPELKGTFDAVVANPPFVKWERIPSEWQARIADYLSGYDAPKADLYLAFVKIGLDLLKPGGHMLYILPHTFLLSQNAQKLRNEISATCWVNLLADLSEINVFEDTSAYPILLVLQRKTDYLQPEPQATIVRCTAYPGHALEEALEGNTTETSYYTIYRTGQVAFQANTWRAITPREMRLQERLSQFPVLSTFLVVREGFITGKDLVFIRPKDDIPPGEEAAYRPYLRDREMRRYRVPDRTSRVVFYPYEDERLLEAEDVQATFPKTWAYLESHEQELRQRPSLYRIGEHRWWRPLWPRPPKSMLRPKIVAPHLILLPRFGLDAAGRYAVSHSPLMYPKDGWDDLPLLRYFLGVLNSSVGHWQVVLQSHRYRRGYAMLESNTLKEFRVPSPATVSPGIMAGIQAAVIHLIQNPLDLPAEQELNLLVAELYGILLEDLGEVVLRTTTESSGDNERE